MFFHLAVVIICSGKRLCYLADATNFNLIRRLGNQPANHLIYFTISGVDAGVPFYGIPDSINPADVKVPFLGHFALGDDWCTKDKVEKFAQGLKDAGHNNFEVHFYDVRN